MLLQPCVSFPPLHNLCLISKPRLFVESCILHFVPRVVGVPSTPLHCGTLCHRVYSDTLRPPLLSSTEDVSCMMLPHKSPAPDVQRFYTRRRLWHYWSALYCQFHASNICCDEHAVKRVLTTMTEPALSEVFKQTRNFYCVAQPPFFTRIDIMNA